MRAMTSPTSGSEADPSAAQSMSVPATASSPPPSAPIAPTRVATPAETVLKELTEGLAPEVIGSEKVVRLLAIALLSEGHVLVEGVPGLAKTMLVRRFAERLGLSFKRIQFTPDMLP